MNHSIIIYLVILFFASFVLTYLIRRLAIKKEIIDIPNQRSSHSTPTPRGGGLSIVIVWFFGITYFFFKNEIDKNLYFALLSGLLLAIIGILDDIFSIKPSLRLIFQVITACLALYFLGGFNLLISENKIISILLWIVAPIGIVWFINLYNFLDGIDGYASIEAIFISLAIFFFTGNTFLLILIVSTLGFLAWNWPKAKIFMGDVGSTQLGFILAVLAIYFHNDGSLNIIIWLMLSSIFWFDATYTLIRRFFNKEKLSEAHKKHAYQRFVQAGNSHLLTDIYAILLNGIIFILCWISYTNYKLTWLMLVVNIIILIAINFTIDKKVPFKRIK